MRPSPNTDPAYLVIWQDNANVPDGGPVGIQSLPKGRDGGLAILRMDGRQERAAREGHVASQTKQDTTMLCRPQFVDLTIEVPQSDVCRSGGICHAVLTLLEELFRAPPSVPLYQQRNDKCGLQREDGERRKHNVAMPLPDAWFLEQHGRAGGQVAFA